jgi:hypothetical protein
MKQLLIRDRNVADQKISRFNSLLSNEGVMSAASAMPCSQGLSVPTIYPAPEPLTAE